MRLNSEASATEEGAGVKHVRKAHNYRKKNKHTPVGV